MITRLTTIVFLATTLIPGSVLGQTTYTIPDSLRYLRLPDDPTEFVEDFVWKANHNDTRRWPPVIEHIFRVGCVADGGWAGDVFAALEKVAETDFEVRWEFASGLGLFWRFNNGVDRCTVDHSRIERLLTGYIRAEYEAGVLEENVSTITGGMLNALTASDNPDTYALVREILHDMRVVEHIRSLAWPTLQQMRQRIYGETKAVADSTVWANAVKAGASLMCLGYVTCHLAVDEVDDTIPPFFKERK